MIFTIIADINDTVLIRVAIPATALVKLLS